ncbi:MAG: hypothetical protein AAFU53_08100 [Cyanobacteria bacterium J06632_3]
MQKGAVRSLFWFTTNMLKYQSTMELWGPKRTHLIVVGICALNGDTYCVFGHAYALELNYLKQTGKLFPLTEHQLMDLCGQDEAEILATLQRALTNAGLESEILILQRMRELHHRPELATTEQDRQLIHLIRMFATLNACSRKANVPTDQGHGPINKNRAMRDRYRTFRKAERTRATSPQSTDVIVLNPADLKADPY